ncbi:sialate O-acetylesterase [Sphingomonas sp. 2SG]|uniref:beta strand repeat-containing protein n=1 Tax=Sphingomonas sp. 2SG TaxID=2502201 RepID=UPI0010F956D1|nr:sialate O-acetylesterase [Sphingomonas sp. 2SG]
MSVLTNIPNNASARDWRDTVNALIGRVTALEAAGVPVAVPAPKFTTQPSLSPTSGTAGTTLFAATPGVVSNGAVISRVWLLNGTAISNGITALPASSGTLTYQETASGAGGTTTSTVQVAAVAAATATPTPAPAFTSQPSISPSSGTAGATTFTATPGMVSNGSITSRSWTINGTVISSGLTASPASSGTLSYQETATGSGGAMQSTVVQVTVATAAAAAPTFTAQPSISPSSGTAGATTFTATPGTVSNGTVTSRAWSLNGSVISTALTAAPAAAGTLTYQETATGTGGTATSTIRSVTVAAAAVTPAPAFTAQPTISPSSGAAGSTTFTATPGTVSNGSIASRSWTLNGTVISSGLTATPASAGTLVYQEVASGSNGTAQSSEVSVTVSAAAATPAPAFTAQPTVSPSGDAAGTTFTATPGTVSNGTVSSRSWTLDGTVISTSVTATPTFAGTLVYREVATGSGGTTQSSAVSVTVSASAGADFTMTQLAAPNRIYQRQTLTGGGQGKGAGTISVAVNVASLGTPRFRTRAADGSILQASTALPAFTATGAQTLQVTGIDARAGWFYLDLSADGSTWKNGTVLVGMGRLVAMSGQSQAVRQFGKMPSYSGTNASLGVSIEPNSAVFARYSDSSRSVTTPAWAVPADSSNYDSTFVAEFLRRQVADRGVNCGVIGHAVGATAISTWQPGQTNNADLRAVLEAAGGFEAFYWHQGGDDAGGGTSAAAYQTGLSGIFGDLAARNAARGSSFERYVTTMATRTSGGAGSTASVQTIRKAALDWSASNGATYLEPHDVVLEDAVHQGQPGSITLARHLHRATTAATDQGPTIVSGTRSGVAITLTTSAAVSLVGSPTDRFAVFAAGTSATALAIASLAASGTKITVTLSADPGSTALDLHWLRHPDPSGSGAAANMIYDTYNADGISIGRQLQPTLSGPVGIAAIATPTPSPTPTSTTMKDTFTAADGTAISGRALDTGQVWSAKSGTWTTSGGQMRADGSGVIMVDTAVSSPNYDVEGDLIFLNSGSNNQNAFLIGHGSQDGANRFQAGFYGSLGRIWSIGPVTGNGYSNKTDVASANVTDNVTYKVKVQFRLDTSTNKVTTTLIVDGVTIGAYVGDAGTYTSAGYAGVRQSGSSTPTDTTGVRWDNFTVTPI